MSTFDRFYRKEDKVSRSLEIDEDLYEKLNYLSKNIYDASINQLVNASIERIIEKEDIKIYEPKRSFFVSRSFLIRENSWEKIYKIKKKYRISMTLIVNIAVKNAIDEWEEENKKDPTYMG